MEVKPEVVALPIAGMTCDHCVGVVRRASEAVPRVRSATVHVVGIPVAALGLFGQYGPMAAALAMSLSSVTVVPRSSLMAGVSLESA